MSRYGGKKSSQAQQASHESGSSSIPRQPDSTGDGGLIHLETSTILVVRAANDDRSLLDQSNRNERVSNVTFHLLCVDNYRQVSKQARLLQRDSNEAFLQSSVQSAPPLPPPPLASNNTEQSPQESAASGLYHFEDDWAAGDNGDMDELPPFCVLSLLSCDSEGPEANFWIHNTPEMHVELGGLVEMGHQAEEFTLANVLEDQEEEIINDDVQDDDYEEALARLSELDVTMETIQDHALLSTYPWVKP